MKVTDEVQNSTNGGLGKRIAMAALTVVVGVTLSLGVGVMPEQNVNAASINNQTQQIQVKEVSKESSNVVTSLQAQNHSQYSPSLSSSAEHASVSINSKGLAVVTMNAAQLQSSGILNMRDLTQKITEGVQSKINAQEFDSPSIGGFKLSHHLSDAEKIQVVDDYAQPRLVALDSVIDHASEGISVRVNPNDPVLKQVSDAMKSVTRSLNYEVSIAYQHGVKASYSSNLTAETTASLEAMVNNGQMTAAMDAQVNAHQNLAMN